MRTPFLCRHQASWICSACEQVIFDLLSGNALYLLRSAQGVIGLGEKHYLCRLEAACDKSIVAGDSF